MTQRCGLWKRANVLSKRAKDEVRDTRSATVGGLQTADLLAALGQFRLDRDGLCRAGGVDRQALDRTGQSDPPAQFVAICAEAERRGRDPFIGMQAGERWEPRDSSLRSCSQRFQQLGRLGSIAARGPLVDVALLVVG